jgi:hypothetical protein
VQEGKQWIEEKQAGTEMLQKRPEWIPATYVAPLMYQDSLQFSAIQGLNKSFGDEDPGSQQASYPGHRRITTNANQRTWNSEIGECLRKLSLCSMPKLLIRYSSISPGSGDVSPQANEKSDDTQSPNSGDSDNDQRIPLPVRPITQYKPSWGVEDGKNSLKCGD